MSDSPSSFSINLSDSIPDGSIKKYMLITVLGLFCINTLILDVYLLTRKQPVPSTTNLQQNTNPIMTQTLACPQSCMDLFHSTVTTTPSVSPVPTITPTFTPTPTATLTPTPAPTTKEFFIPLGSGVGSSTGWTALTGVGASIDPANYGQIANAYFEVTAETPTGSQNVNIRLYNANTYQAVANSTVSFSGGAPTLLISSPITLSQGNNVYQVQMQTQLQKNTYIDQARIRIDTK